MLTIAACYLIIAFVVFHATVKEYLSSYGYITVRVTLEALIFALGWCFVALFVIFACCAMGVVYLTQLVLPSQFIRLIRNVVRTLLDYKVWEKEG